MEIEECELGEILDGKYSIKFLAIILRFREIRLQNLCMWYAVLDIHEILYLR